MAASHTMPHGSYVLASPDAVALSRSLANETRAQLCADSSLSSLCAATVETGGDSWVSVRVPAHALARPVKEVKVYNRRDRVDLMHRVCHQHTNAPRPRLGVR
jgi:hypothetical protein